MAIKTYKHLFLFFLLLVHALNSFSQTYYPVYVTSGTQIVGGVIVTVTSIGNVASQAICGVSPYRTWVGGYKFKFSNHVSHVRSHMMNINTGDEMMVKFNGTQYNVTSANLSYYAGACATSSVTNSVIAASNGDIIGTSLDTSGVRFDAAPATYIDSVEIDETNAAGAGVIFDFSFIPVCTNIFSVSADTPCAGGVLHLTATGTLGTTNSFTWTGPGFSSTSQNPLFTNIPLFDSGMYYLTANIDTCTYHLEIDVQVKTPPSSPLIIVNHTQVCSGDTLLLSASALSATSYSWSGPASFSSPNQNASVYNFASANTGYYYVTDYLNGCSNSDSVQISLKPRPNKPTSSSNSPVCQGSMLNFSSNSTTSGVTYQWSGPNNFTSSIYNPSISNIQLNDSGNYIVSAILNGCASSDTTNVIVKPLPASAIATSNSPVCQADTLKLIAGSSSAGVTYQWTGPNSFASAIQNSLIPNMSSVDTGSYYLILSLNGCNLYDTLTITMKPLPATPAISGNSQVCNGSALNLAASSTTIGVTYNWTGPNNLSSPVQNLQINPITMPDSGYYHASAILNGCKATDSIKVFVKPLPASVVAGSNSPVCQNNVLNLTAGSSSTGVTYSWLGPSNYTSSQQNPSISNVALSATGIYKMIATLNGCTDTVTIPVTINPIVGPPIISISASPGDTLCLGENVTFTALSSNGGNPIYQWMNNGVNISGATGNTYSSASLNNGNNISCRITGTLSCQPVNTALSNVVSLTVQSFPAPGLILTAFPSNFVQGNNVTFTAHLSGNTNGLLFNWLKNNIIIPGATNSFYTTNNLHPGDSICVLVHSTIPCTVPDSVIACLEMKTTGVNSAFTPQEEINISPNPFDSKLIIKYFLRDGSQYIIAKIYNISSQLIYTISINTASSSEPGEVSIDTKNLIPGIYILQITTSNGSSYIKKIEKY